MYLIDESIVILSNLCLNANKYGRKECLKFKALDLISSLFKMNIMAEDEVKFNNLVWFIRNLTQEIDGSYLTAAIMEPILNGLLNILYGYSSSEDAEHRELVEMTLDILQNVTDTDMNIGSDCIIKYDQFYMMQPESKTFWAWISNRAFQIMQLPRTQEGIQDLTSLLSLIMNLVAGDDSTCQFLLSVCGL